MKLLVLGAVLVATLVITPHFTSRDRALEGFAFGEPELRAAVEGRWRVQVDERSVELAILLARAPAQSARERGWVREAAACEQRSLVRSAAACIDVTTAPLEVRLAGGGTTTGVVRVRGRRFHSATLEVDLTGKMLRAVLSTAGAASETLLDGRPATLVRISDG